MKKRKYLYRLAAIMVLVLVLPVVLFFNLVRRNSFDELEQTNEEFYEKRLESYMTLCDQKIRELATFTASISAYSKNPASALSVGAEGLRENYYQYYVATKELEEKYSRSDVTDWGIYYYDLEKILRAGSTMPTSTFIDYYGDTEEGCAAMTAFLSPEEYASSKTIFSTTNSGETYDGRLLLGFCTGISQHSDQVLFYYMLSAADIQESLAVMENQGVEYYLMDGAANRILLAWGDSAGKNAEAVLSGQQWREISGIKQKVLYRTESTYTGLTLVAYISEDSLNSNVLEYAHEMSTLLGFTIVLLVVICLAALFMAYKPVHELTKELDYTDRGEFEMIRSVINDRGARIEEQEMLIMDLLLNHLMYGVPISQKRMKRLGIEGAMDHYSIFLIDGYVLTNSEAETLTKSIEHDSHARLFTTDWQGEEQSVLILFSRTADISGTRQYLEHWLQETCDQNAVLYTGKTVERLDDIQLSLRSCFKQVKKKSADQQKQIEELVSAKQKEEQQSKLKEDVLSYLEQNFRDPGLSQAQVADHFRISTYTLSRLFRNQVGLGFTEYLVGKRVEYAKELLLTTSFSVQEISDMAGFSSVNYFSRTFKGYVGLSPSAFRADGDNLAPEDADER